MKVEGVETVEELVKYVDSGIGVSEAKEYAKKGKPTLKLWLVGAKSWPPHSSSDQQLMFLPWGGCGSELTFAK